MDPFLEEPTRWGGVHSRLINSISDQLAAAVSPDFIVDIEERVYLIAPNGPDRWPIVPDAYVVTGPRRGQPQPVGALVQAPAIGPQAAPLVEAITAPTLIEPLYAEEIRDRYIEIRDARNREVVTMLEVFSPFNKAPGTPGRRAFLRKRKAVMASQTHWIEVDLLRAGERPAELAGKSDYYALLKRGGTLSPYEVWYFDLRDMLPTIAVPLRPPFTDVPLNLATVLDDVYARGRYANSLEYTATPPPPRLRPADVAWTMERVQEWLAKRAYAEVI
jgi:hypothetical protein